MDGIRYYRGASLVQESECLTCHGKVAEGAEAEHLKWHRDRGETIVTEENH
jgi:hypothetical protein